MCKLFSCKLVIKPLYQEANPETHTDGIEPPSPLVRTRGILPIKLRMNNDRNGTRTRTTTLKGLWLKPVGPCGLKGKDNCQLSHGLLTCSLLIISSSLLNTVLLTISRWIYSSLWKAAPPIPWESFCGNPAAAARVLRYLSRISLFWQIQASLFALSGLFPVTVIWKMGGWVFHPHFCWKAFLLKLPPIFNHSCLCYCFLVL